MIALTSKEARVLSRGPCIGMIEKLLSFNPDLDAQNKALSTALHRAISKLLLFLKFYSQQAITALLITLGWLAIIAKFFRLSIFCSAKKNSHFIEAIYYFSL